jgi:serine protease
VNVIRTRLLVAALSLSLASLAGAQTKGSDPGNDDWEVPMTGKTQLTVAEKVNASALYADTRQVSRVIVHFDSSDRRNSDAAELVRTLDGASRASGQTLSYVRTLGEGGVLVEIAGNTAAGAKKGASDEAVGVPHAVVMNVMETLARDPGVVAVEPDAWLYPQLVPNDTSYSQMWHLRSATVGINAEPAWDRATGTGIRVAVLDTGIVSHSDLNGNVIAGWDMISSATTALDGNGRDSNPADEGDWSTGSGCPASNSSWHGTHVAGTVAAVTNNSRGIAGVAFNARIMPVRVLGRCGGSISDIADGVTWASGGAVSGATTLATSARAQIQNLSLGGGGACSTAMQNAINGANSRGSTVIVAAGNSNVNASNATPANCSGVVTVAATNHLGGKANYSNFGTVVDVAAPGGQTSSGTTNGVLSTLNAGTTVPAGENYAWYQGTSMATPHVAGVAALLLSSCARTPAQVEAALRAGVRPFVQTCSGCGTGIVDANLVLNQCGGGGTTPPPALFQNLTDYQIRDNTTVESPISVTGRTGNAPSGLVVNVRIIHTYIGDLKVDLVAPSGQIYTLHNRSGGSADNIIRSYTVNASAATANGTWRLRVNDNAGGDTGFIDSWSLQF